MGAGGMRTGGWIGVHAHTSRSDEEIHPIERNALSIVPAAAARIEAAAT